MRGTKNFKGAPLLCLLKHSFTSINEIETSKNKIRIAGRDPRGEQSGATGESREASKAVRREAERAPVRDPREGERRRSRAVTREAREGRRERHERERGGERGGGRESVRRERGRQRVRRGEAKKPKIHCEITYMPFKLIKKRVPVF
ncbi:hypothetical protein Syun_012839 [Stephania yunnanensis]|uniref:Uncharacterized protein n=1 Tax=Stephania yunnanensis TaxID=152371 RepID=A0AAP0PHY3_9MAGN